jgi:hypothetical protein
VTQIRPRLDDDLAADVQAYAEEWHISFNAAVTILLRQALQTAPRVTVQAGDATDALAGLKEQLETVSRKETSRGSTAGKERAKR